MATRWELTRNLFLTSETMLVWWKKMSSVVGELSLEGVIKPNPLRIENHLTFPLILASDMVFWIGIAFVRARAANACWLWWAGRLVLEGRVLAAGGVLLERSCCAVGWMRVGQARVIGKTRDDSTNSIKLRFDSITRVLEYSSTVRLLYYIVLTRVQ